MAKSAGAAAGMSCHPVTDEEGGNGRADTFRFDGAKAGRAGADGIDFSEGDQIRFADFAPGTFGHVPGGNDLAVSADGGSVVIDSLRDLQELDWMSPALKVVDLGWWGVRISIDQPGQDKLVITLDQMAEDFNPFYDDQWF